MAKTSTKTADEIARKSLAKKRGKPGRTPGQTLTPKMELFARLVFDGHPAYKAYTEAGYKAATLETAYTNSSQLLKRDKVQSYISRLRAAADSQEVLSFDEKRKMLAQWAKADEGSLRDRQKAIEIDNKMAGHDAPQVVEVRASLIDQLRG